MRSITEIRNDINRLQAAAKYHTPGGAKYCKIGDQVAELRRFIIYLETNPSETYLEAELIRLKEEAKKIEDNYSSWLSENPKAITLENPKQTYFSDTGLTNIRTQIKTLNYLLNKTFKDERETN